MGMSFHDAQLFHDGRIPAGMIDPTAPEIFRAPRAPVKIINIREKPEAIRARMVKAMTMLAGTGTITEQDLLRVGFARGEIEAHFQDALRQMMVENPTFASIQWVA